jgi:AraC-like DNA-binding protein
MFDIMFYLLYIIIMINEFKYFEPYSKRPEQRFYMAAVGLHEVMENEIVNRPGGTWDWLLMFFNDPVTIEVNGTRNRYPANTLMIWDDTDSHYYGDLETEWVSSWIHFQGSVIPDIMQETGLGKGVYPDLDLDPILEKYLPIIYEERLRNDMDSFILEELFTCFLREVSRLHSPCCSLMPERIHSLQQFIDTRYAENLGLDDLCRHAGISKPHLICEFRKYIGVPPIDYLIHVRLRHARSLLLNRNLNVSEIAERVGYSDICHFSKLFKKHMGKSPSAFRG